jgi:hypothetical protein
MQEGSGYTLGHIGRPSLCCMLPLALSYATQACMMYPQRLRTSQILASNLLANNTVVVQAELNAGTSLIRAAPVCRPPKLGRARPRVPLEGHTLSPKTGNPIKSIEFPTARTVKVAD